MSTGLSTLRLSIFCFMAFLASISSAREELDISIAMLGTGTPIPDPSRSGPAVALIVDDVSYLFDFGPGVVRQAASLSTRYGGMFDALVPDQLRVAFLTHLHSDHTAGFSDLLLTGWVADRDVPLQLYGPEGVEQLVAGTLDAYQDDIKYRVYGLEVTNDRGWRVDTHVIQEGVVFNDNRITVTAFPVIHGSWPNAFGYRVEAGDQVIVISGDLSPNDKIEHYSRDADYLLHEVYCQAGFDQLAEGRQHYHGQNHTSTRQLAALANAVEPRVLILYHVLFFGCTKRQLMDEIYETYTGKVILADDLDVFTVDP